MDAANKTPTEIASPVWEITKSNVNWGRIRIANQLVLLNIFISAFIVRKILNRPTPRKSPVSPTTPKKTEEKPESLSIPAWYPNHDKKPKKPESDSKTVPCNIEHRLFREMRITGYRLKSVA